LDEGHEVVGVLGVEFSLEDNVVEEQVVLLVLNEVEEAGEVLLLLGEHLEELADQFGKGFRLVYLQQKDLGCGHLEDLKKALRPLQLDKSGEQLHQMANIPEKLLCFPEPPEEVEVLSLSAQP